MSNARLEDLIKKKKPGDVWVSLEAPSELRFWNAKLPWKAGIFQEKGMSILSISVKASGASGKENRVTYTKGKPLVLGSGIHINKGFLSTTQSKSASFSLRVDSVTELKECLVELSNITGFTQWEVRRLEVYNKSKGIKTEFKIFNPNCVKSGDKLSAFRFENGDGSKLYPEVSYRSQMEALDKFCETHTKCTLKIPDEPKPEVTCADKQKTYSSEIKLRKKQ